MSAVEAEYDVVIAGGGPAGSLVAALLLTSHPARRVLVLERDVFPRPHVGETALPNWAPILRRVGLLPMLEDCVEIEKVGITFSWGPKEAGESWNAEFREHDGRAPRGSWHVDRGLFDDWLLQHAARLGATVHQRASVDRVTPLSREGRVLDVGMLDDENVEAMEIAATVDGRATTFRSAFFVDATGQARLLSRLWSIPIERHPEMNNYAVYGYWRGSKIHDVPGWKVGRRERWAVIGTSDLGWIWHIPIGVDLVSVGLVTHQDTLRGLASRTDGDPAASLDSRVRELYLRALDSFHFRDLLADASLVGAIPDGTRPDELSVAVDWAYGATRVAGPRWFLAGDAACFVDPILSSGLMLATQGAMMVAHAIHSHWDDPDLDRALLRESVTRRYRALADAYHRMARAWYRRNLRGESWHWQAHQERLRTGVAAVWETAPEALTAVAMGTLLDPLEDDEERHEPSVGSSYRWLTAHRLFEDHRRDAARWDSSYDIPRAQLAARRKLMDHWRGVVHSKLRIRGGPPCARDGYHTSDRLTRWERTRFVELVARTEGGEAVSLAYPDLGGRMLALLRGLDGTRTTHAVVSEALTGLSEGSRERDRAAAAACESVAQLTMLALVDRVSEPPHEERATPTLLWALIDAAAAAVAAPCVIEVDVDWLGERVHLYLAAGEHRAAFLATRLAQGQPARFGQTSTALSGLAREPDAWHVASIDELRRQFATRDPGARAWSELALAAATRLVGRRDEQGNVSIDAPVML